MLSLLQTGYRLLICSAITYLVYRWQGWIGFVECAPLFGIALARPILNLLSDFLHTARTLAYRGVEGIHFAYRGTPIQIVEDPDHRRWLRVADVRRILTGLPANQVLAKLYPAGVRSEMSTDAGIEAEALESFLEKAADPATLRFKRWLQREVRFPAAQSSALNERPR